MSSLGADFFFGAILHPRSLLVGLSALSVLGITAARAWAGLCRCCPQMRLSEKRIFWVVIFFGLADLLMLAALPWLGLSYGRVEMAWGCITLLRQALVAAMGMLWAILGSRRPALLAPGGLAQAARMLWLGNLLIAVLAVYGLYVEPFRLPLSAVKLRLGAPTALASAAPAIPTSGALRILHLSDLHVERLTRREYNLLEQVRLLQPDMIIFTGDAVNIDYRSDPQTWADTRWLLSQFQAPYGVYAVLGTPAVDTPQVIQAVYAGLDNITLLQDELRLVETPAGAINLLGVSAIHTERDGATLKRLTAQAAPGKFNLLLYHTPDLAEAAAAQGIDLYLAGHTHGGQVRLPFYGAIVTSSHYGKRFEGGHYQVGQMNLYVSRGIGMEGLLFPRARFLCPPELVLLELSLAAVQ